MRDVLFIKSKSEFQHEKITVEAPPPLNEERQEFATLYFDDYIYVFFGFNSKKGINLSSIERINVNTNSNFEVVYINEQINLSSLGCAHFIDDTENDKEKAMEFYYWEDSMEKIIWIVRYYLIRKK